MPADRIFLSPGIYKQKILIKTKNLLSRFFYFSGQFLKLNGIFFDINPIPSPAFIHPALSSGTLPRLDVNPEGSPGSGSHHEYFRLTRVTDTPPAATVPARGGQPGPRRPGGPPPVFYTVWT